MESYLIEICNVIWNVWVLFGLGFFCGGLLRLRICQATVGRQEAGQAG